MKTMGKFLMVLLLHLFLSSFITQAADFTKYQTGYRTMGINKQIYPDGTYSLFTEASIHYGAAYHLILARQRI